MNVPQVPSLSAQKEPASPRPPAVGKEVRTFHDTNLFIEHSRTMEYHKPDSKAIEVSSNNSSPNPSPPPAYRWSKNLPSLLDDHQGVDLFREFLKQEGHETRSLDFLFGAKGLKKADRNDTEMVRKIINVLYDKMVKRIPSISQRTKDEIKGKLNSGHDVDLDIFDAAQKEVEDYMFNTTYRNFLKSDLYIQHLEPAKGREYPVSPEAAEQLPTLHEDKELNFSLKKNDFRNMFFPKKRRSSVKCKPEAQAGFLKSPSAPYHTKYAPFLPASARDSELQSLSSDVQTDDTMSQTDSSVTDYPIYRTKPKRQQKSRYPFIINRDNLTNTFIPRTSQSLPSEVAVHTKPEVFAADLFKRLLKAKEDLQNNEIVREKMKSVEANDSMKSESFPRQKFPYVPEEDNDQAILDQHISWVFPETTPTFSPTCATPPAPTRCLDPAARDANLPQDLSCGGSMKVGPSPFSVPFSGRSRRDPDTRSNDSGALTDWISEDNLPQCHRNSEFESNPYDCQAKRTREKLKSKKLSSLAGSSSSCFDSGVSTACEFVQPAHSKVTNWLETKRCASEAENDRQGKTSPVLSRSSSSRKAGAYTSSRSGVLESGPSQWPLASSQMPMDPSMVPPDTMTSLREARRILEDETRAKMGKSKYISTSRNSHDATRGKVSSRACDTVEDGISHRKQSKKSFSSGDSGASSDMTIIGYSYGLDSVPFKSRLPGKNITLKQFKTLLNKRGNFRYFFKSLSDDFGTKVVLDEVTDDQEILPLWEGKVFCIIESMDDGSSMNDD